MPAYDYYCEKCDQSFELFRKVAERNNTNNEECDRNDCNLQLKPASPLIGYDSFSLAGRKPTDGFRDRLKEIKKNVPGAQINTI